MGNLANRFKGASAQSVSELLEMPNLNRASELEARMQQAPVKRGPKSDRFAPDKMTGAKLPGGTEEAPALPVFTSKREGVQARVYPEVLKALKEHNQKVSDLANRLLTEHAHKEGWL